VKEVYKKEVMYLKVYKKQVYYLGTLQDYKHKTLIIIMVKIITKS